MFPIFNGNKINQYIFVAVINPVLTSRDENTSHNSTVLKCELANFSVGLLCILYNISTNNADLTIMSTVNGSNTNDIYPTQLISLTNLTSGTTYNYCVVAVNVTTMMEIGDPVCGNFTTNDNSTDDNPNSKIAKSMCLNV